VLAVGDVADGDVEAALTGPVQEALDLGVDVKLVPAPVADVHFQLPVLQVQPVDHLDGVFQAYPLEDVGSAVVERVHHPAQADGDHPVEPADHLPPAEVGAPAPAARVEVAKVTAVAVEPARV
jgi:hypothetical protein